MLEQVMADNGFPVPLVEGGNCRVFQFHSGTNGDTELFKKSRNINGFRACRIANNLY